MYYRAQGRIRTSDLQCSSQLSYLRNPDILPGSGKHRQPTFWKPLDFSPPQRYNTATNLIKSGLPSIPCTSD